MRTLLGCLLLFVLFVHATPPYTDWLVGVGIADLTGTAAEVGFMGYAMMNQKGNGVHLRQRSRAFIFAKPENPSKRVVYVSSDICMVYQMVKAHVIEGLQEKFGDLYNDSNVMLSGTHTHAGPAGYAYYFLYDISSFGFINENHWVIVNGIIQAIVNAHEDFEKRTGGRILMNVGRLTDANINRSPTSYLLNPPSERQQYPDGDTDKIMTVWRLQDRNGVDLGAIAWFAVHGTSMNNTNGLISGDNKGFASYAFERRINGNDTMPGIGPFVAAFGQSNEGDVSPNTNGTHCPDGSPCDSVHSTCNGRNEGCRGYGPGMDDFQSTEIIGQRQADLAYQLWQAAATPVQGDLHFVHQWVDMENVTVTGNFTKSGATEVTCPAALGDGFAGGTTDGPGEFDFVQGSNSTNANPFFNFIAHFLHEPTAQQTACQAPKSILLNTGGVTFPGPWTPAILPLQMFRFGNFILAAVPGEFTTMSGRRLRASVATAAGARGVSNATVVIAGLCNSYSHYIATWEEYQVQRYEAGSTLYGPNTLAAYQMLYSDLTTQLLAGETPEPGPNPPYLNSTWTFLPPVIVDTTPEGKRFGDVATDAESSYTVGDVVRAQFWGANPRNNLRTADTFLKVDQLQNGTWVTVALDGNWETKMIWQRSGVAESLITIEWDTPEWQAPGTYRLRYFGDAKNLFGSIVPINGTSSSFQLNAPAQR